MHFYRKCWFGLFKEQFIFLLNFGQNYFVQLGWNWFFVRLPVTNAWNCHSLYTAFSSNVGAWGMWACSLFLSCNMDFNDTYVILHRVSFNQHLVLVLTVPGKPIFIHDCFILNFIHNKLFFLTPLFFSRLVPQYDIIWRKNPKVLTDLLASRNIHNGTCTCLPKHLLWNVGLQYLLNF